MKQYRSEYKYQIDTANSIYIQNQITGLLEFDKYSNEDGFYNVHSLYFDDYYDECAFSNISGNGIRFKYRLRYYNDDLKYIVIEKKEKYNSYCYKRSQVIDVDIAKKLISGDVDEFLWGENDLLKTFAIDILSRGFMPKAIVSYKRRAFVEPISHIRITFDSDILTSSDFDMFLVENYFAIPVLSSKYNIMEVKFDDILPAYVHRIIRKNGMIQQAYSKYYHARTCLDAYR